MCLLEQVVSWDAQHVRCRSGSHRATDHPLRAHGRLGSACLIEYAAQAAAVHGALLQAPESRAPGERFASAAPADSTASAAAPRAGMLASARAVELAVDRIDDIAVDLLIEAHRLHSDERSALYAFAVYPMPVRAVTSTPGSPSLFRHEQIPLAEGRLSLWLQGTGTALATAR
jgi:predicted hotdog family 3-hydroxylacyl-ACP dehydratase